MMAAPVTDETTISPGFPGVATRVAYSLPRETPFETYEFVITSLLELDRGVGWWLGDALNLFEAEHGKKYTTALPDRAQEPGLYQRCADAKWLANKFHFSFRYEKLTLSHHRAVVSLEQEERRVWLERAVTNQWTVKQLRDNLQLARKIVLEQEAPDLLQQQLREGIADRLPSAPPESVPTSIPPARASFAADALDDFLSDDDTDAKQAPPAPSGLTDLLPTGHQVSPVEPHVIGQLLTSVRAIAVVEGGILPPVWVFDRLWCPIYADVNTQTGRCTVEAVRIIRDLDFLQKGYEEQLPTCSFADWPGTNGDVERVAEDYAGLRVWAPPPGGEDTNVALWYVLLPQRTTFVGRLSPERQATMAAAIAETSATDGAIQETTRSAEAYDFPILIGEQHLRKLEMLVDHLNRRGGDLTIEALVESMIDARFEASGLDLGDYEGRGN